MASTIRNCTCGRKPKLFSFPDTHLYYYYCSFCRIEGDWKHRICDAKKAWNDYKIYDSETGKAI